MALTLEQNAIQIRTICCYLHKVENLLDLIPEDIESSIGSMASVPLLSLPEFSVNTHMPIRKNGQGPKHWSNCVLHAGI